MYSARLHSNQNLLKLLSTSGCKREISLRYGPLRLRINDIQKLWRAYDKSVKNGFFAPNFFRGHFEKNRTAVSTYFNTVKPSLCGLESIEKIGPETAEKLGW